MVGSQRRLRGDLIQVFKLLKGLEQINYNNFFKLDENTIIGGENLSLRNLSSHTSDMIFGCTVLVIE